MTQFPAPVPKPASAGTAQSAIANTRQAFVNIRNGPSTRHRIVGALRNFTLCAQYPATRTTDGWVWVEQPGIGGWAATSVVNFETVTAPPPITAQNATPFDNRVAAWHWRGDSISETTIETLAQNIQRSAPAIKQVWVKTSDYTPSAGAQWMGYWDTKRAMAIDGPASIDRWVQVLGQFGMEFVAWCVPRGNDVTAETNLIIQACQRPGVKAMILDVEPYDGFWSGGQAAIRPFMTRIRRALPGSFHIGLCVDPRSHHYETIFPREWQPFINSIHPMVYWRTMRRPVDELLAETYEVWSGYGKPIIPALQGDAEASDINTAITLSTGRHGARGISWWRLGVIGPIEYAALNKPISGGVVPPVNPPTVVYADEQIVKPGDARFSTFSYSGQNDLQTFLGTWGWNVLYKTTESQASKAAVRWTPQFTQAGKYDVEAFIPMRHSTTRNARYKVHGVKNTTSEILVTIDQTLYRNQWVSLGVFEFEPTTINAGTVFLNDLTGETAEEIAFDAVRWRRVVQIVGDGGGVIPAGFADGFDSPIGTNAERRTATMWPGQWYDASPFGRLYFVGTPSEAYHTGADLNMPRDGDAHSPVYSAASGVVVFASRLPTWGNVVIVKHDPLVNGMVMYGRYAHVENLVVSVGQKLTRGQQVASIGNAFGRWAYHLHFDLSPTTILESNPAHWPGKSRDECFKNYVDPKEFLQNNRPRT